MMSRLSGYRAGINLGLWLSQNNGKSIDHFKEYITRSDIARIASWGMDHIRLPVDYFTFEDDTQPGVYKEEALIYIDHCLEWCCEFGLNMILDLHAAPGFAFYNTSPGINNPVSIPGATENTLFLDETLQQRFVQIWRMFAQRYVAEGNHLVFDLMNELVWQSSDPWNRLWLETVAAIRAIDPARTLMIGGNRNNDVNELANLAIIDDPGVVYTFHIYEPGMFTHQRSPWIPYLAQYPKPVTFPFSLEDHRDFFDAFDALGLVPPLYRRENFGYDFLNDALEPARRFMAETGKELHCGEFGVNENCDIDSSIRWFEDIIGRFEEMGIGHTVWNYLEFSHIMQDQPRKEKCIDIIRRVSARVV
jgi:endoglucanase